MKGCPLRRPTGKRGWFTVKTKLIVLVVILLCLIPSAIAVASYYNTQNAPVDNRTAVSVSIDDLRGRNTTLVRETEGDAADRMIELVLKMRDNAQPISALPESLNSEKFFNIAVSTAIRSEAAEFYLSTDPSTCYMKKADGTVYKLAEEDASAFISTEYAASLYEAAVLPTLTVGGSFIAPPDSASWNYKNYAGAYVEADVASRVVDDVETYELMSGLSLVFDTEPDYAHVLITGSDGNALYDANLSGLASYQLEEAKQVKVEVTAKWYEDPARSFSGQLGYTFNTFVSAPAEYALGLEKVIAGRFTAVVAKNVTHPEKVLMTSSMEKTPAVTFYAADSMTAVALIPVDMDTPSGMYTLTFQYGGIARDVILTVENWGDQYSYYSVDQNVVTSFRSDAALAQFDETMNRLMATGSATRYFKGSFLQCDNYAFLRGFGRYVYLNGDTQPTYRNNGIDYGAGAGLDVQAWNDGEVVFAGMLDYSGNMVVIEHGYGLKTWYYNMGSTEVSTGDIVQKGDRIGTTGITGFAGASGVHVAMSVGNTFVCPYDTWADSEIAAKVILPGIDD